GHDYEGLSYLSFDEATPFFILDMFNLRLVDVNIEQEIARVQTGATLGEVYYKISEKSNTHALPAGYGNMIRKYGLTVDLIQDAELIDVNGRLLDRHPVGTSKDALLSRSQQSKRSRPFKIKSDFLKSPISKHGMESIFNKMKELKNQMITFNPLGGRMNEISEFAKPYPHRAGNLAKIEYETYWEDAGTEAANQYVQYARLMHEHMTPYVSKNPREAFFNYRDLDIGVNHNGKNSYEEGKVYGVKYWKE
nr:berberine bridge enzyme-like 8 [Tanacetum cinerariifolium]